MDYSVDEAVAAQIRAEMARQRVTQEDLGVKVGLAQGQLSKRLAGKVSWKVEEVAQIARALGVPATQLIPEPLAS